MEWWRILHSRYYELDDGAGQGGSQNNDQATTYSNNQHDNNNNNPSGDAEFIEITNKKGQRIKLPKVVDGVDVNEALSGHFENAKNKGRKEIEGKLESIVKDFNNLKEHNKETEALALKYEEELQKLKNAGLSVEEQLTNQKNALNKKFKETEFKLTNEKDNWYNNFRMEKIQNELYRAMSGHDVENMGQALRLITMEGNADIQETGVKGNYDVVLKFVDDGIETDMTPKEAVEKWLARPENSHWLKRNLKPGGGTSVTGGRTMSDGLIAYSRSQLRDPNVMKEYHEKVMNGEKVRIIEE